MEVQCSSTGQTLLRLHFPAAVALSPERAREFILLLSNHALGRDVMVTRGAEGISAPTPVRCLLGGAALEFDAHYRAFMDGSVTRVRTSSSSEVPVPNSPSFEGETNE